MVDLNKNIRFRERFTLWRTHKEAKAEMPYMDTAILINDYVDEKNLATIKDDLASIDSPKFQYFEQHSSKASRASVFGACLYGKFILEEYIIEDMEHAEKEAINAIRNSLESLYSSPLSSPADKLLQLINNGNLWLSDHALLTADLPRAKALCLSLYAALKLVRINLENLPALLSASLWMYGIKIPQLKTSLSTLNRKIAKTIGELELRINPPAANLVPEKKAVEPLTLDRHINAQCLTIIEQVDSPLTSRFSTIISELSNVNNDITSLLVEKTQELALNEQINHAATMVQAIDDNELHDKKYSLALIEANQDSYDSLIKHASEPERAEWLSRKSSLSNPDYKRFINDWAQYGLSTLSHPLTLLFRSFVPTNAQKKISSILPITFDTECKVELKAMAQARVTKLVDIDLPKSKQSIEQLVTKMSTKKSDLKPLLLHCTLHDLQQRLNKNKLIIDVLTEYEQIRIHILQNQEQLKQLEDLSPLITIFINQHDSFLVWLSLLLAKICAFFKTKTATSVQAAKTMKATLGNLKNDYNAALDADFFKIESNTTMSAPFKEKLLTELTPIQHTVPHPGKKPTPTFHLVSTLFNKLTPVPPLAEEEKLADFAPEMH